MSSRKPPMEAVLRQIRRGLVVIVNLVVVIKRTKLLSEKDNTLVSLRRSMRLCVMNSCGLPIKIDADGAC